MEPKVSPAMLGVLSGSQGCGKTTFLQQVAKQYDIRLHWIPPEKCETSKEFLCQLNAALLPTVEDTFNAQNPATKTLICIDHWDNFLANDRNVFSTLCQFLTTSKRTNPHQRRLLCICSRSVEKKFQDIHPSPPLFTLQPVSESDVCLILKHRFPMLHLSAVTRISDTCRGNLNTAIEMATFECSSNSRTSVTPLLPHGLVLSEVDTTPTLIQLFEPKPARLWKQLLSQDPWMHPLRFHENCWKELTQRQCTKQQSFKIYDQCLSALLLWDQWMTHTLHDDEQTWMHASLTVLSQSIHTYLDAYPRKKKSLYTDASLMEFTKLLSQLSLQKKHIQNTFQTFRGSHYPIHEL
jgi:hypothetical protein